MQPVRSHADSGTAVTWTQESVALRDGGSVGVRVYRAARRSDVGPVAMHLHAGAFVTGNLDSGRTISTLLAEAGATVVSIDYPLAPQHIFPKALETGSDVLGLIASGQSPWASKKSPLFVAGEEAGGNLAAALALMARDQQSPVLSGQILLSPMVDACLATCSVREAKAGPAGCQWADGWHQYLGSAARAAHPYASPIGSSRLAGLAPALLVTAEDDLLRDETLNYARRLRESGVTVRTHLLSAPTGWPCALYHGADPAASWAGDLRDEFAKFFAEATAASRIQSVHHHVQA